MSSLIKKILSALKKEMAYRYSIATIPARRSFPFLESPRFIFLVTYPEAWNSVKQIYNELCSQKETETLIVAVPRITSGVVDKDNNAAVFFEDCAIDYIRAYDEASGVWFDLSQFAPSHVVYIRPYEIELPPEYRPSKVALYARTCLFPYAYLNSNPKWYFSTEYDKHFMRGINYVCSGQASTNRMLRTAYRKAIRKNFLYVSNAGYPRFELVEKCSDWPVPGQPITILWTPRWAVRGNANCTTFFAYVDKLIKFVLEHKETRLICRPHPLAFDNFVKENCMTAGDVNEFKRFLEDNPRLRLDEDKDYLSSFQESSILISDASSIVIEYFLTGKPIIYTGEEDEMSEELEEAYQTIYSAHAWEDISTWLSELLSGIDKGRASREKVIERINPKSSARASVMIVNELLDEWRSR